MPGPRPVESMPFCDGPEPGRRGPFIRPRRTRMPSRRRRYCSRSDNGLLSPQSSSLLSSLPLQLAELLEMLERELRVCMPVALANNLRVHERAVLEVDVGQHPSEPIDARAVVLEAYQLPADERLQEVGGFPAKRFRGLSRVDGFRRVDANQSHGADAAHHERVTIDDSLHHAGVSEALGASIAGGNRHRDNCEPHPRQSLVATIVRDSHPSSRDPGTPGRAARHASSLR